LAQRDRCEAPPDAALGRSSLSMVAGHPTSPGSAQLRRMELADVPRVMALQRQLLPSSAVTQLGPRFLARFYRVALVYDGCEAIVACDANHQVVGAALATGDHTQFHSYVTPRVFAWLLGAMSVRWGLAVRFLRSLGERQPRQAVPAELLLLFVDQTHQGRGCGTQLLGAIEDAFSRQGIVEYRVSVRSEITDALAFYARRGFRHEEELIVLGRPMTYLARRIGG
jgi:GNAT superfamily N-acetyltransferase